MTTKKWMHGIAALMFAFAIVLSTNVFAEDDVFVDEGDGDFDTMPAAPQTEPSAPVAQQPAAPAPDMSAVEEELATPTIVEEKAEPAAPAASTEPAASSEDLFADEDTTPAAAEVAKPAKIEKKMATQKVVKKTVKAAKPEKKVAAKSKSKFTKKGKGYFAFTNGTCKLKRAPASTKSLGETAASKKIWVEDVDTKWVKVWNRDGKEAFLSRDCLK